MMSANAATLLGWALPPARAERATKSWRCSACHRCFVEAVHAADVLPTDRLSSALPHAHATRILAPWSEKISLPRPRQGVFREAQFPLLQRRLPRSHLKTTQ